MIEGVGFIQSYQIHMSVLVCSIINALLVEAGVKGEMILKSIIQMYTPQLLIKFSNTYFCQKPSDKYLPSVGIVIQFIPSIDADRWIPP